MYFCRLVKFFFLGVPAARKGAAVGLFGAATRAAPTMRFAFTSCSSRNKLRAMPLRIGFFLWICCLFFVSGLSAQIKDYQVFIGSYRQAGGEWLVLRKAQFTDGRARYWLIDVVQLRGFWVDLSAEQAQKVVPRTWAYLQQRYRNSAYMRLRAYLLRRNSGKLLGAGLSRCEGAKGWVLTMDLCPSERKWEQEFLTNELLRYYAEQRKDSPLPITIAVSAAWLRTHKTQMQWLRENADFDICWANHSDRHPYAEGDSLQRNFLLKEGTDLEAEFSAVEKIFCEQTWELSPFYRFPGLVSDSLLYKNCLDRGLFPLSTDSWLAKGQQPKAGSIALIHLNGNEPLGLRLLRAWLEENRAALLPLQSLNRQLQRWAFRMREG